MNMVRIIPELVNFGRNVRLHFHGSHIAHVGSDNVEYITIVEQVVTKQVSLKELDAGVVREDQGFSIPYSVAKELYERLGRVIQSSEKDTNNEVVVALKNHIISLDRQLANQDAMTGHHIADLQKMQDFALKACALLLDRPPTVTMPEVDARQTGQTRRS